MPKIAITPALRAYRILSDAIESGITLGYRRAHKHTEAPHEEAIVEQIRQAVLDALDEVVDFEKLR